MARSPAATSSLAFRAFAQGARRGGFLEEHPLERCQALIPELSVVIEPACGLHEGGRPEPEPMLTAGNASFHEAGAFENLHVFRHAVEGHRKAFGKAADCGVSTSQESEDGAPSGVRNGGINVIQL